MRYHGHERVSLLNGGWTKWTAEGHPTTTDAPRVAPATFTPRVRPELRATIEDVAATLSGQSALLLDARPAEQYRGDLARGGRAGHIPGAVNLPATGLLTADGTWKSDAELAAALDAAGVAGDRPVVAYCGGGMAATGVLFALHRTGRDGANYDGSWNEWGPRTDLPVETGASPA